MSIAKDPYTKMKKQAIDDILENTKNLNNIEKYCYIKATIKYHKIYSKHELSIQNRFAVYRIIEYLKYKLEHANWKCEGEFIDFSL